MYIFALQKKEKARQENERVGGERSLSSLSLHINLILIFMECAFAGLFYTGGRGGRRRSGGNDSRAGQEGRLSDRQSNCHSDSLDMTDTEFFIKNNSRQ